MNESLIAFLRKIDGDFPINLSEKTDILQFAEKIVKNGIVCAEEDNGSIVAAVLGYANNFETRTAFISVVGTLKEYRGRGFAEKLVKRFIKECKAVGMERVMLYTHHTNEGAIRLYRKIGFTEKISDRSGDLCLVYEVE